MSDQNQTEVIHRHVQCPHCRTVDLYPFLIKKSSIHAFSAFGALFFAVLFLVLSVAFPLLLLWVFAFIGITLVFIIFDHITNRVLWWIARLMTQKHELILQNYTVLLNCRRTECNLPFQAKISLPVQKFHYTHFQLEA